MITGCYSFWKHNTQLFLGRRDLLILFGPFFLSRQQFLCFLFTLDAILPVDRSSTANRTLFKFYWKKTKNLRVLSGQRIESYLVCSFIGMRGFFWECVWKMVVIPAAILDADRIWHFSMTNRLCLFCQWLPRGETNLQPSFIELSSPFRSVDNKLTFSIDWPPRNFFFLRLWLVNQWEISDDFPPFFFDTRVL